MYIEEAKINESIKKTMYKQFLLDLNKKTSLNKDVETLFEKLYTDFNVEIKQKKEDEYSSDKNEIIDGYISPSSYRAFNFDEDLDKGAMENIPSYDYSDLNVQDWYLHETGHMIDYYLMKRLLNNDKENYSIYDKGLKDFIEHAIKHYENNDLPKTIVDYFNNSNDYKTNPTSKYLYENLSDIVTSLTKGKYFNNNYHDDLNIKNWDSNKFLIYGHNNSYYYIENEPNQDAIIKELFANYIAICLLPNKEAFELLKDIKNDKGENLQDVMNNFIQETITKL